MASLFVMASFVSYFTFLMPQVDAATPYMNPLTPFSVDIDADDFGMAIAHDGNNNIYVAVNMNNATSSKILKYSSAGVLQTSFSPRDCNGYADLYAPTVRDVIVAPDGYLYTTTFHHPYPFGGWYSCVQKYDTTGAFIAQLGTLGYGDGTDLDQLAADDNRIFVSDPLNKKIYVVDSASGAAITQFGSGGAGDGQLSMIDGFAYYNNQFYVNDSLNRRIQIFDSTGNYVRQFSTHIPSEGWYAEKFAMNSSGDMYMIQSRLGTIRRYSNSGTLEMNYRNPTLVTDTVTGKIDTMAVDSNGVVYTLQSGTSDKTKLYRYESITLNSPQYKPTAITATDIGETTATLNWEADSREPYASAITDTHFRIVTQGGVTVMSGSTSMPIDDHFDASGLYPGTTHTLYVSMINPNGTGPEAAFTFTTTGIAPLPISLDPESRTLTINGDNLLGDGVDYSTAFTRSLVSFNGSALKACSTGTGLTAQEIITALSLSYPNVAQLVTDDPPCYLLFNSSSEIALTDSRVIILLPEGFDFTARGSVRIDGGELITFNDNVSPSISINGNNPASGILELPKRLSFSGVATPLAKVTVTVHSDPVTCEATASAQGDWSCMLGVDLPAGVHTVYLKVVNPDNSVEELGPYTIRVGGDTVATTPGQLQNSKLRTVSLATTQVARTTPSDVVDDSEGPIGQTDSNAIPGKRNATQDTSMQDEKKDGFNFWPWVIGGGIGLLAIVLLIFISRRKSPKI